MSDEYESKPISLFDLVADIGRTMHGLSETIPVKELRPIMEEWRACAQDLRSGESHEIANRLLVVKKKLDSVIDRHRIIEKLWDTTTFK